MTTPREELSLLRQKIYDLTSRGEEPSDEDYLRLEELSEQTGMAEEIDLDDEDLGEEDLAEAIDAALLYILETPRNEAGEIIDPEKARTEAERIIASSRSQK